MRVLDIARGAYVRSPKILRDAIAPALALLPVSLRYGRTYRNLRADIARSRFDTEFVTARRLAALRSLLEKARLGSRFWGDRIENALGPATKHGDLDFETLTRLPVLTRDQLADAGQAALTQPAAELDAASTSGSSGQPLLFWLDKDRSPREFAFVNDVWARTGYTEGAPRCVLRGLRLNNIDRKPTEWEAALRELRCSPFSMSANRMDDYLDEIEARQIQYLHGYPSAIEILCRHILQAGRVFKRPIKGVFPISEPIFRHQRDLVRTALPSAQIASFYGLSERVLFASEIEGQEETYAFEPLYGHAELLDEDGIPIREPGSRGRIVGTGFMSTGMPFIRYDTGDSGELVELPSQENLWRLKIRSIFPRRQPEFLIGLEGNRIITPTIVPVRPEKFYGVSEYQFFQDTPGQCVVKVVPRASCGESDVQLFIDELQGRVGSNLKFRLQLVEDLASNARGKRPFIDQRIKF